MRSQNSCTSYVGSMFGDNIGQIIQNPYTDMKKEIKIMNPTSLLRNTAQYREPSISSKIQTSKSQKPRTGTGTGNCMKRIRSQFSEQASNTQGVQVFDCSFSSNFPFFSAVETQENFYTNEVKPSDDS